MDDLAVVKRLGYLFDLLGAKTKQTKRLLKMAAGGYCFLDMSGPKTGKPNKKWRVIENLPKRELMVEL